MSRFFERLRRFNPKKAIVVSAFLVAMAGAAGLGVATKQFGSAAGVRDSGSNPILNQGSVGCLTVKECVADFKANKPGDVQKIYADRGLTTSEYSRFEKTAVKGKTYKNGDVVVDGQVVIKNAWSMGRNHFAGQRDPIYINGKKYYKSPTTSSFVSNSIDTFVMFDDKGVAEFAILTACGNPVWGTKQKPEYGCKSLNAKPVSGKKDTYDFTTTLKPTKLAKLDKLVYNFGDGSKTVTKGKASDKVTHAYTKPGTHTATVTVYYKLPGGKVVSVKCTTKITVKEAPKPVYECKAVTARALNKEETEFRVTVTTNQSNGAVPESADFILDNSQTTPGVTTKEQGNFYKDYTFARDGKDHTVVVKVNFNVAKGVTGTKCKVTVTAGKEEPKAYYECKMLTPSELNEQKTKFRFTVTTREGNGATLKDADFTVNGSSTVTGVTDKDEFGNIYKDYEFEADGQERTVSVKVNFLLNGQTVTAPANPKCEVKVTPEKTPVCVVDGKEYPIGSPECEPYKCPIPGKEDLPKEECVEDETPPEQPPVEELPKTGMGSVLGIFAGTSILGAIGHRLFMNRRQ